MNATCLAALISLINEINGRLLFEKELAGEYSQPPRAKGYPTLTPDGSHDHFACSRSGGIEADFVLEVDSSGNSPCIARRRDR